MQGENKPQKGFSLNVSDLQSFYLGFAAVFLCTGFFYNFIFFRLFGIRVEFFFTLQDYLASSIEKVYLIITAILVASSSSHVARYLLREKKRLLSHRLLQTALFAVPLFICALGIVFIVRLDNPVGYYLVSFAVYISCDYLLFRIVFKGNQESYSRFFLLTAFLLYLLLIGSAIVVDHDAIYKEPLYELKRYRVHFSDNIKLDQGPLVLLEANSNYYFFYDKKKQQALVLSRNMIEYIENFR